MKSLLLKLIESELRETSSMAGGDVQGHMCDDDENKTNSLIREDEDEDVDKDSNNLSRKDIVAEMKLREVIKSLINRAKINIDIENKSNENKLFSIIDKLILIESNNISDSVPHSSTGINVLEDLLKSILSTVETDFKKLTTNPGQQSSFRSHLLNALVSATKPETLMSNVNESHQNRYGELLEGPVLNIKQDDSDPGAEDPYLIDVDGDGDLDPVDKSRREFGAGLEDKDKTGRNSSLETYNKISQQVIDSYSLLDDPVDQENFKNFLITNFKLYFDKWGQEQQPSLEEPTTDSYESSMETTEDNLGEI